MLESYLRFVRDNPHGYWFKHKWYGWGWTPVTWQGWLVVAAAVGFVCLGAYIGEIDDAPGAALLSFILALFFIFVCGLLKGEKLGWHWGRPKLSRSRRAK